MSEPKKAMTPEQLAIHERLRNDFLFYASRCLFIETKAGAIEPFVANKAQRYIHYRLEQQLQETGRVRALILKGRQQGCSTYVGGRFYHKASWNNAKSVYIMSHEASSTNALYGKVELYQDRCPEMVRPELLQANRKTLQFANRSKYVVGTAGSKNTGRGLTIQLFHGSEVAFYENTDEIQTGVLQTIADLPGTEIILESTANGVGNYFHQMCMDAVKGRGVFQIIFVPWYWQDEYRMDPPRDWVPSQEEYQIQKQFDLDLAQLYWRNQKIVELKTEWKFKQEYPFTINEAFQSSGNSLISSESVIAARKSDIKDDVAPLVMGVDPGRKNDRTVILFRRGREIVEIKTYDEMNEMRLAGIIGNYIDQRNVKKCFIDYGQGYGTIDRLRELGYDREVTGVYFNQEPMNPDLYRNKRTEMAFLLRDWLLEGGVNIPDSDEFEVDLMSIPDADVDSRGLYFLAPKDKIRETTGRSPDLFDAACLTFAAPVKADMGDTAIHRHSRRTAKKSSLQALNRQRSTGQSDGGVSWGPSPPDSSSYRRKR